MISYIEIIELFETIQQNSNYLNSFNTGLPWENTIPDQILYPTLFLERPLSNIIDITNGAFETYSISFYVLDRTFEGKEEINKSLNQSNKFTKLLIQKLIQRFNEDDDCDSLSSFDLIKWEDNAPDINHGWRVSFQIKQQFVIDYCLDIEDEDC